MKEKKSFFECDSVVVAVSQAPKDNIVSNTTGLDTKWGLIVTDEKGNTTKKGTFACGDVVTGAKTVVEAAAQAKVVAETIDEYCKNN
ncbi:NADPH-dependent glutamate synthase beta subunit-like oxidoreductase [Clostridium acetobutylicum]|nr:NADPH-dependent glutamate synthase beta subunit-like oxidoreductase [Clostridium acetobutylicum]